MTAQNLWIIFDSVTQIQSRPLTQEQLQSAIFKMKKSDFNRFHVWTTGWENWQALKLFLDGDQTVFIKDIETAKKQSEEKTVRRSKKDLSEFTNTKSVTKSVTAIRLSDEMTKTSFKIKPKESTFDGDSLTWSGATPPKDLNFSKLKKSDYSKRAARHELKIEILLISAKGKTFRSHSKNISLSGTMLLDNVPFDYYGNLFDVVVVNKHTENKINSRVQLKAKTIGEGLTSRIQFESVTPDQKKKLSLLLNEYIEAQRANEKKSA